MLYTTVLTKKEWKICYIITRYLGCTPIECCGSLSISAKTMEEAISIAKRELKPDAKIIRCEVWYINERTLQDYTRNL